MADIALIITSVIFGILIIIGAVYFLVYFQHPDDKWVAWWPKAVVILGISLACFNVFLLPLDVANQGQAFVATGGIPMAQITQAFFIASIVLALAVVPFTMYYYEGMDESDEYDNDASKQVFYAVQWTVITLIVYFLLAGLLWYYAGYAYIPIVYYYNLFTPTTDINADFCVGDTCTTDSKVVQVYVSFAIYMIAIASFIGWVMFAIFGGVGLPALPFDLLIDFKHRPKRIKLQEYTDKKRLVGEQAALLLQASAALMNEKKNVVKAKTFAGRKQRQYKTKENEFKRDVLYLETQYRRLEDAYKNGGGNPLFYFAELAIGVVGSFVSLLWFLHLILYLLPVITSANQQPIAYFLNDFFTSISNIPIIGISFYGLFSFWLLMCVIKGVTKLGVRFLFITIHPIKFGETMMSSLVFNVGIMLFCSLAVTQFCTVAFADYARYTAILTIFGAQIKYLAYINVIYNVLIYILTIFSFISLIYVWVKPYDYKQKPII